MVIVADPMVPQRFHYDKWWKKLARKLSMRVAPDRTTYDAYVFGNTVICHPAQYRQFKEKFK